MTACESESRSINVSMMGIFQVVYSTEELKGGTSEEHCFRQTGKMPTTNSTGVKTQRMQEESGSVSILAESRLLQSIIQESGG